MRRPGAEDFQQAWQALASKELSLSERVRLQQQLLEKWAEVDLEGALDAAMAEAWDNDRNPGFEVLGTSGHLLMEAFRKIFSDRPLDSWDLIASGRYGVGSQILRRQWVASVGASDGALVASMLGQIPPSLRDFAVEMAMRDAITNPERLNAVLGNLLAHPPGEQADAWLKKASTFLPSTGDPASLRQEWSALPAGSQRTLSMMKWGASLRNADETTMLREWASVPSGQQGEAARTLLSSMTDESKALVTAIDLAMDAGEWEILAEAGPKNLRSHANHIESAKLAEWAMNLPDRSETVELFHSAVNRYIGDDLARARDWLNAMEPGDWRRERGFAELSQQALWRHRDPELSRWALDQLADPEVKAAAEGWRGDWERQTGRTRFQEN